MKEVVFPTSIKAMLASFLVDTWKNSDVELEALRMAVGLNSPDEFWKPLGAATVKLSPRDKINLLAHIIAYIGSDNFVAEYLVELPAFLASIDRQLLSMFEGMSEADTQLVATEFIICEFLRTNQSVSVSKKRISMYIADPSFKKTSKNLVDYLKSRWETDSSS